MWADLVTSQPNHIAVTKKYILHKYRKITGGWVYESLQK